MNADTLYCLCRKPYESNQFMIECDVCKEWFHGTCVNVKEESADDIEFYHCPHCQLIHGPVILKKKRIHQRQNTKFDTSESKTGSMKFLMELKQRTFPSADGIPLVRIPSHNLSLDYFNKFGFDFPILIADKESLNMNMPSSAFTISNIENLIGSDTELDVVDVAMQENCRMLMGQWVKYFNDKKNRHKIYNVISLEFSNTRLADLVSPPSIIHQLSWVDKYWPCHHPTCPGGPPRPYVQRYCLMSVQDSFTDFHIDLGGTCVWYHIFKGEKIFYLIKPTPSNLVLYERWLSSSNQSETFFADQVDTCYILPVKQGETILLPTGWIHAVLTPQDSLVFGGNFLCDFNISIQLKVYEIERRVRTQDKFMYPNFESMNWYAAQHFLYLLSDLNEKGCEVGEKLGVALKALVAALKSWSSHRDHSHVEVPSCPCHPCSPAPLLRDLFRLLKTTAPYLSKGNKRSKEQTKKTISDKYRINYRNRPANTSIRLRLSGGKINECDSGYKRERYEDDDDDDDDEGQQALVVDERRHPQQLQSSSANRPSNPKAPQRETASISDLLQVSGYEVKSDSTSHCSMRDAIQGMLTMSQMDSSGMDNFNNADRSQSGRQRYYSDDIEEELNSCYKDDNFVYPSVASSDSEDGARPGKRSNLDEAWNPKGASRAARKSARSSRSNEMRRKGVVENKKHIKSFENSQDVFDYSQYNTYARERASGAWSSEREAEDLSLKQSLVDTIHDMHNYSATTHLPHRTHQPHLVDDEDEDENEDDDDVDLAPKKGNVFTPQKRSRNKKTPTTARQRLAQKLKLNKDCF